MQLTLVLILHVLVSLALIVLVLFQRGKGSEMGAAFGAGASGTMFGSQGATPFMVKLIAGLAVIFFCTTLGLHYMFTRMGTAQQSNLLDLETTPTTTSAPTNQLKNNKQGLQQKSQQTMPENNNK
jgi:preprotein translocase subunit SecG